MTYQAFFRRCLTVLTVIALLLPLVMQAGNAHAQATPPGGTSRTRIGAIRVQPRNRPSASAASESGEGVRTAAGNNVCYSGLFDYDSVSAFEEGFNPWEGVLGVVLGKDATVYVSLQANQDGVIFITNFFPILASSGLSAYDLVGFTLIRANGEVRGACESWLPADPAQLYRDYFSNEGMEEIPQAARARAPAWEGEILFGEWRENALGSGYGDQWEFNAEAGQTISLVVNSDAFDPVVQLFGPDGAWAAQDDDNGIGLNSSIAYYEVTRTGTYRVLVTAYDGQSSGTYYMGLGWPVDMAHYVEGLRYGDAREFVLETTAGDAWWFEGQEGQVVTIYVAGMEGFDPWVELYAGWENFQFTRNDDCSPDTRDACVIDFVLPYNAGYRIMVRGYANMFGAYVIELAGR